ncbi:MAG: hypothetical protein COA82_04000 [Alkaliphilus sp.]|nr:hypothetical protein [bacterium AH-315-E09]PHS35605.1 MAG: hypothetical protein COA82_04000 [Alkaliphilus sp.]
MSECIVKEFWKCIDEFRFDDMGMLMHENAKVNLPNTCDVFYGAKEYVEFNKKYPGQWRITVEKKCITKRTIVTAAKVTNEESGVVFYVTSFFEISDGKIKEIIEYWGDKTEPPEWRIKAKGRRDE